VEIALRQTTVATITVTMDIHPTITTTDTVHLAIHTGTAIAIHRITPTITTTITMATITITANRAIRTATVAIHPATPTTTTIITTMATTIITPTVHPDTQTMEVAHTQETIIIACTDPTETTTITGTSITATGKPKSEASTLRCRQTTYFFLSLTGIRPVTVKLHAVVEPV